MASGGSVRPHRGVLILVFGILSIVVCFIFGIVAWVMGNGDLAQMQAGTMDRSGEGLTKAGKICGMVGVGLAVLGICLWVAIVGLGVIGAAAGAGAGAGTGP
jgi:hypothetical protein